MSLYKSIVLALCVAAGAAVAEEPRMVELNDAVVRWGRHRAAAEMLVDEVNKRCKTRWTVPAQEGESNLGERPIVSVKDVDSADGELADAVRALGPEGYGISLEMSGRVPIVSVIGRDRRGVFFGCGRLLRELRMAPNFVQLALGTRILSAPALALRGHQLGYRPKTNSYDAWTPEMWEQYIRDLVVWGVNAIELIPPRSDDAPTSPHFPLPPIEMMARMSGIADKYGIDVWIWYPAMDRDYSNPETVQSALKEWGDVFKRLPRVDAVFVPGGDPGHTQPKYLMALLEEQTKVLKESHPNAQMWMSPQSFNQEWMDEFIGILTNEQPAWLSGVVFGPQNRPSLDELREQVPSRYKLRLYPDITHSLRSQYVVEDWDVAYAITEDREVINPRPRATANILRVTKDASIGFITYSEGCNDDLNKVVWSAMGWDPNADVEEVVRQYARYFIGGDVAEKFANGLLALEENWRGPLLTNDSVDATLKQFQAMEEASTPEQRLNWRFQQGVFRAYYDAYTRARLVFETELEKAAMDALANAKETGSIAAIDRAQTELGRALTEHVALESRTRIFALAEALFQSIRMQLSVPLYKAIDVGRGAHLDLIDRPLNDREWLEERFTAIRAMGSETERLAAVDEIVHWERPRHGGFYDDLGNPAMQPHLVRGMGPAVDPEYRASSRVGFGVRRGYRMSWNTFAESIFDAPLKMEYAGLDPQVDYRVRIVYAGDQYSRSAPTVRLRTDDGAEIHAYMEKPFPPRPLEFAIPRESTRDGALTLEWNQEPGRGGTGRACQVAEVWLEPTQ